MRCVQNKPQNQPTYSSLKGQPIIRTSAS